MKWVDLDFFNLNLVFFFNIVVDSAFIASYNLLMIDNLWENHGAAINVV